LTLVSFVVAGLRDRSWATQPVEVVAEVLDAARARAVEDGIASTVLPLVPGTAGNEETYTIKTGAAEDVVATQFPTARLPAPTGGTVRVLVQNGAGTSGLGDAAGQRLQAAGLRFVAGGNADSFDHTTSRILVASSSPQDRERAQRVAAALGLDPSTIAVDVLGTSLADVVVVLGVDFAADVTDRGVLPTASPGWSSSP
jgi:hypothetical protein